MALLIALALAALGRRRRTRDRILRDKYLRVLMSGLFDRSVAPLRFPGIDRPGARLLLIETLGGLVGATHGLDVTLLREVVCREGLDRYLLGRIRRTLGYRRAKNLALLANLPVAASVAVELTRYRRSRNRYVRFYAFLAQLAADPSTSLRLMSDYPSLFSPSEVTEIMSVLRRGMLPIAYDPLIGSPNANLRLVGLGIVRCFGIVEAEAQLLRLVAEDEVPELGREALYALCSMHRPVECCGVKARLATMRAAERKSLLRYMATEGYSSGLLQRLFGECESPYCRALVQSYKRSLA